MPVKDELRGAGPKGDNEADEPDEPDEDGDDAEPRGEQEGPTREGGKREAPRFEVRSAVMTMVLAVVQTSLIAWFGFSLSGRLELDIKERKATVEGAKAMGELIDKLSVVQTVQADRSLILQLAMFGEDAIAPTVVMAMSPGPYGVDIPIFGLQRLGITHHDSTCKALASGRASNAWMGDAVRGPLLDKLFKEMKC